MFAQRHSGRMINLQRPYQSGNIVRVYACGICRVTFHEHLHQFFAALSRCNRRKFFPVNRVLSLVAQLDTL